MLPFGFGLIPMVILAYGLYAKRRGFIWLGGAWLAIGAFFYFFSKRPANDKPPASAP